MRVVGIVSELRHEPGVYGQGEKLEQGILAASWDVFAGAARVDVARTGNPQTQSPMTLSMAILHVLFPPLTWFQLLTESYRWLRGTPLVRVGDLPGRSLLGEDTTNNLPPPRCIVVPASLVARSWNSHSDPALYGLFLSGQELRRVMAAEGGNVDLWIMPLATARKNFKHHGGPEGQFSIGLHVPHPKDHNILVPAKDYSTVLLNEVLQDWVRAFEALGAKRCVICDTTIAKAKVGARDSSAGVDIAAELSARYETSVVRDSSYGPGTFDPKRALDGKRWIADYSAIGSIVEGRQNGNQTGYRETVKVNASFGLDVSVLKTWGIKFEGGFERRFELAVEFYPK